MAVTKVIADILNLNEANTTKSFKMPTGSFFSGTPVEGMIRNDTSQSSQSLDFETSTKENTKDSTISDLDNIKKQLEKLI